MHLGAFTVGCSYGGAFAGERWVEAAGGVTLARFRAG